LGDEYLDLVELQALDAELTARGDYFDARFDDPDGLFSVIQKIAAAGRCKAYLHDGLLKIDRIKQETSVMALFTPSNIVKDSFTISYSPPGYRAPDSLRVEYIDSTDFNAKSIDCNYGTKTNEQTMSFFGVTTREHAYREGMFVLASSLYQHTQISFETGLEGALLKLGDVVLVAHDTDNFAQWGTIYNTIGVDKIVMSNPINFNAQSEGFIYISNNSGGVSDALAVTEGSSPYELILTAGIPAGINTINSESEPSRYVFVTTVSSARRIRVLDISYGDASYNISGMVEDDRVHTADGTTPPTITHRNWSIKDAADASSSVIEEPDGAFWVGNASLTNDGTDTLITWDATGYTHFQIWLTFINQADGLETTVAYNVENQLYLIRPGTVFFKAQVIPWKTITNSTLVMSDSVTVLLS